MSQPTAGSAGGQWRSLPEQGTGSGIDWVQALREKRCDPYLAWEDTKDDPARSRVVTVLVEWRERQIGTGGADRLPLRLTHEFVPQRGSILRPYRCRLADLVLLNDATDVVRFELEISRSFVGEEPGLPTRVRAAGFKPFAPEWSKLLRQGNDARSRTSARSSQAGTGPDGRAAAQSMKDRRPPLVGVVDDVVNFQHPRWRVFPLQASALLLLWDQSEGNPPPALSDSPSSKGTGASPGAPGEVPAWTEFPAPRSRLPSPVPSPTPPRSLPTYGRELDAKALDAAVAREDSGYTYRNYGYPRVRDRDPVGSAARPTGDPTAPAPRTLPMRDWSHGTAVTDIIDGEACGLPPHSLMFASLPLRTTEDTSGGSLAGLVLDAIHHFLQEAAGRPLIVNVSYGTHQGPHDGTSMFERALADLLTQHDNLHVVLPAGNSHLSRTHQQAMLRPGEEMRLHWLVLPDDRSDSFMELWCHTSDQWQVQVRPPAGLAPGTVSAGSGQALWRAGAGGDELCAAVVFPHRVAQGDRGTMALVAVGPTFGLPPVGRRPATKGQATAGGGPSPSRTVAPAGVWTVTVKNTAREAQCFHAWVLRDDAAPAGARSARGQQTRQSYLLDTERSSPEPNSTLNSIATLDPAQFDGRLFVVGALRHQDGGLATYSAAGPTLNAQRGGPLSPSLVVAADQSMAQPGLLVQGMFGSSKRRVSGTSLAAAVLTGRLFKHLSEQGAEAKSFCMPAVRTPSTRPIVPAGKPRHALPELRGELARVGIEQDRQTPGAQLFKGLPKAR